MNTKEAIKHLKSLGFSVKVNEKGRYIVRSGAYRADFCPPPEYKGEKNDNSLTERELIKRAKIYTSDNPQTTALKSNLKKFTNGRQRTYQRNILNSNNEDLIDELPTNKLSKQEDNWCWD